MNVIVVLIKMATAKQIHYGTTWPHQDLMHIIQKELNTSRYRFNTNEQNLTIIQFGLSNAQYRIHWIWKYLSKTEERLYLSTGRSNGPDA